jgi:hypothetical protein
MGASPGTFLEEYAVGKFGDMFPDGTGRLLKAGMRLATDFGPLRHFNLGNY